MVYIFSPLHTSDTAAAFVSRSLVIPFNFLAFFQSQPYLKKPTQFGFLFLAAIEVFRKVYLVLKSRPRRIMKCPIICGAAPPVAAKNPKC